MLDEQDFQLRTTNWLKLNPSAQSNLLFLVGNLVHQA